MIETQNSLAVPPEEKSCLGDTNNDAGALRAVAVH